MVAAGGNTQRWPRTTLANALAMHFSAHCVVRSDLAESLLLYEKTQPAYCSKYSFKWMYISKFWLFGLAVGTQ